MNQEFTIEIKFMGKMINKININMNNKSDTARIAIDFCNQFPEYCEYRFRLMQMIDKIIILHNCQQNQ